jgi:hypothetical protein
MIKVSNDVIYRCVADEHMLIPVGESSKGVNGLFILTETGARIWQLLSEGVGLDTISETLASEYEAPAEMIRADAEELISKLLEAGLVTEE